MLKYDFHIHSCLSPCGNDDMTPANIAGMSFLAGLDAIAVCDHNSCLNIKSAAAACAGYGIKYLCGMELCTSEDIHILCFFDNIQSALDFSCHIEENTVKYPLESEIYGNQLVMDENDNIISSVDHLLISGCSYSVYEIADIVHCMGGACYYAHIDKPSYSVISVLGCIPDDLYFDGVEIHDISKRQSLIDNGYITDDTVFICGSDAHQLEIIGDRECFLENNHPLCSFLIG